MLRLRQSSKLVTILVLTALLFTACEIPDISKFTEQSSEMTRGIRKGVKDTENLLKAASERDDLYSDAGITKIKSNLADYKKAMKPTVAALDGLDGYLEALNALSQANKKSGENARAAVTSVGNLVNAVTGFTIGDTALDIATGLVTLAEQFRTARNFRRRVTIAAEIVEGIHPILDENGEQLKDKNGQPMFRRSCTGDADTEIIKSSKIIQSTSEAAFARRKEENSKAAKRDVPPLSKDQIKTLSTLQPKHKWQQLHEWGILKDAELDAITNAMDVIDEYHCGVVDFIKFNIEDLKAINEAVSQTMYTNAREKNRVVLGFYESILANDKTVQNELDRILNIKALIPLINHYVNNHAATRALDNKLTLKNTLFSLFELDSGLSTSVRGAFKDCNEEACGKMLEVIETPTDRESCDSDCRAALAQKMDKITPLQFDKSVSLIEPIIDKRAASLFAQNGMYLAELQRIRPSYDEISGELNAMKNKQNQLDALLEASLTALDAWIETHANLRVAVNTKKPLTASKLAGKVREIWATLNPSTD